MTAKLINVCFNFIIIWPRKSRIFFKKQKIKNIFQSQEENLEVHLAQIYDNDLYIYSAEESTPEHYPRHNFISLDTTYIYYDDYDPYYDDYHRFMLYIIDICYRHRRMMSIQKYIFSYFQELVDNGLFALHLNGLLNHQKEVSKRILTLISTSLLLVFVKFYFLHNKLSPNLF